MSQVRLDNGCEAEEVADQAAGTDLSFLIRAKAS